jgi:hypothetical protein
MDTIGNEIAVFLYCEKSGAFFADATTTKAFDGFCSLESHETSIVVFESRCNDS